MTLFDTLGWIAMALNVWGNLSLTNKNKIGWIIRLVCNAAFIVYSIPLGAWALLANHVIFAIINIHGWRKWSKENKI